MIERPADDGAQARAGRPRVVATEVGADPFLNGAPLTTITATREDFFTSTLS